MYSPHKAKERSYSCLLQLSNIMPLRTVPFAPSVQYPLPKTCTYESGRPTSRSYLNCCISQRTSQAVWIPHCQVYQISALHNCRIWQLL